MEMSSGGQMFKKKRGNKNTVPSMPIPREM